MIAGDLMDSRQVDDGSRYSRKILLATVGLSPQVVTETAYALMVSNDSPFIPSEIIIISTTTGAEQARERLLGTAAGIPWLERLYREYSGSCSPTIDFVTVADHAGMELDDIDSPESSAAFADKILETVRRITDDDSSILYASIAGGRKTMSFYLGYALSVLGRDRDRLYHVLVSPPFESHPEFYFPTRDAQILQDQQGLTLNTADTVINLVNIPFVRLRHIGTHKAMPPSVGFEESVERLNKIYDRRLVIEMAGRKLQVGDIEIKLQPIDFAIYLVFARSRLKGEESLAGPVGRHDKEWGKKILNECASMYPDQLYPYGLTDRTVKVLESGVDASYLVSHLSKIRSLLRRHLGAQSYSYRIESRGRSSCKYHIEIEPEYIEIT